MDQKIVAQKIDAFLRAQKYPDEVEDKMFEFMTKVSVDEKFIYDHKLAEKIMDIVSNRIEYYSSRDKVMLLKYVVFMDNLVVYFDNYFTGEI